MENRKWRVYYQPFPQSDLQASDVFVWAPDEKQAQVVFERDHPGFGFIRAEVA